MWLNQNFLLTDKLSPANELSIKFFSLRNMSPIFIQFKPDQSQNVSKSIPLNRTNLQEPTCIPSTLRGHLNVT